MSGFAEGTPTVQIQLGVKSYTLGWTWGAKRRARETILSRHADPQNVDQSEAIAAAVWASMEKEKRAELSVEDVEEMIHPGNELEVMEKINQIIKSSEPEPDTSGKTVPAAAKMPTAGKSASMNSVQSESTISA